MARQKSVTDLEAKLAELTARGYELREARNEAEAEESRLLIAHGEGKAGKREVDKATLAARTAQAKLDANVAEVGRLRDELAQARQQVEESARQDERQRLGALVAERRQCAESAAQAVREARAALDRLAEIDASGELRISGRWYGNQHLRESVLCLAAHLTDGIFPVQELDRANRGSASVCRGGVGADGFLILETERCENIAASTGGFDNAA